MSEDILCHIMTRLQCQSATNLSEQHLNIFKDGEFWNIILRATGSVVKLNSNSFVERVRISINELGRLFFEKTINIQLLQQILEYSDSDEKIFQLFDAAAAKDKALSGMVVSRDVISNLRWLCSKYFDVHWIERLEKLIKVIELFNIPHNEDDWLSKSIRTLKIDSVEISVMKVINFFDCLDKNLPNVNQDFWKVIRELSISDKLMDFLEKIPEHAEYDIKNFINGADSPDEILIQIDTISSLIQVKKFVFSLMDKETIVDFLDALYLAIKNNHSLV
jgi:hypothetical protein